MGKVAEVKRIYPEAKSGLINWIEQNFQEIEQFVAIFKMKDGHSYTFYDTYSFLEAMGLTSMVHADINRLGEQGEFVKKERGN